MKSKINLYWYKHNEGAGNFGDELNPYIIKKLSDNDVNWIDIKLLFDNKWLAIKTILKGLLRNEMTIFKFLKYFNYNFLNRPEVILAIGSILHRSHSSKNIVWGVGFIDRSTTNIKGKIIAVRGYKTIDNLVKMNLKAPKVVGDPALLLPLIYQPKISNNPKIGIIPHYQHFHSIQELFGDDFIIINLLDNIEKIIDQIASCKYTLSTSLHGIIVSHAYGIQSLWSSFPGLSKNKLVGDNIKFEDYFSSVNIEQYSPILFESAHEINSYSFDSKDLDKLLPSKELILHIQQELISVAPFKVSNKFR